MELKSLYFSCDILILVGENSEYVNQAVKLNQVLSTKASDKDLFTIMKILLSDIFPFKLQASRAIWHFIKLSFILWTFLVKVSFLKWKNIGNVLLECPDNVSQAILLFCQGVGMVPAVLGQGGRRRCGTRGLSMSEADVPNISRLSLSE